MSLFLSFAPVSSIRHLLNYLEDAEATDDKYELSDKYDHKNCNFDGNDHLGILALFYRFFLNCKNMVKREVEIKFFQLTTFLLVTHFCTVDMRTILKTMMANTEQITTTIRKQTKAPGITIMPVQLFLKT